MATINLGSIKFNWQGAYAGGTAYVVDDVVSYNGSSYICKLASTGNLPTNNTYWDQMSSAGTNGTDLTSTLTTQGDLVYRDGSGLQRLGAGTAGQVLQTGGAGANPSWSTVSSDMVLLNHTDSTSAVTSHSFQSIFDDTTYDGYKIFIHAEMADSQQLLARWLNNSTELSGSTDYKRAGYTAYRRIGDNSENTIGANSNGVGTNHMNLQSWAFSTQTGTVFFSEISIWGALQDTSVYKCLNSVNMVRDNSGGASGDYITQEHTSWQYSNYSQSINGIKFYTSSGNLERFKISIYGYKK